MLGLAVQHCHGRGVQVHTSNGFQKQCQRPSRRLSCSHVSLCDKNHRQEASICRMQTSASTGQLYNNSAVMQATPPVRDPSAEDIKPSLRHLDSITSAALKPPEVSSPSHPFSPTGNTPHGDSTEAQAPFQGGKGEEGEVKPLGGRSSGGGGSGGSSSFNWATIKVWLVPPHLSCPVFAHGHRAPCSMRFQDSLA